MMTKSSQEMTQSNHPSMNLKAWKMGPYKAIHAATHTATANVDKVQNLITVNGETLARAANERLQRCSNEITAAQDSSPQKDVDETCP